MSRGGRTWPRRWATCPWRWSSSRRVSAAAPPGRTSWQTCSRRWCAWRRWSRTGAGAARESCGSKSALNGSLTWLRQEDPQAWSAFVALGILAEDAPIAAPAAATFWGGLPLDEADDLLAMLQEEALLSTAGSQAIEGRAWPAYQVHDMLRAVAQRLLLQAAPDGLGLTSANGPCRAARPLSGADGEWSLAYAAG